MAAMNPSSPKVLWHPSCQIEQHGKAVVRLQDAVSHGDQCRLVHELGVGMEDLRWRLTGGAKDTGEATLVKILVTDVAR
jgi:hypothetical protein